MAPEHGGGPEKYIKVIASSARKGEHLMCSPSCAGLPEQAMLPHTPAQVRRDYDSLTIGAKPFMSFLVWPVFSN